MPTLSSRTAVDKPKSPKRDPPPIPGSAASSQDAMPAPLSSGEPDAPQPSHEAAVPHQDASLAQQSAASAQAAAEDPSHPKTDSDVLTVVRQLAEDGKNAKKAPAQRAEALKAMSDLLASHNFDFAAMSAANLAALFLAVPLPEHMDLEAHSTCRQIGTAFDKRFVKPDSLKTFDDIALEASQASQEDREILAEAIGRMDKASFAKLFVAVQRIPGELDKHQDAFTKQTIKLIPGMNLEAFNFLNSTHLTERGQNVLAQQVAANTDVIDGQLMKDLVRPIVKGAQNKSPWDISHAVDVAKSTRAALLALAGQVPGSSKAKPLVPLQNAVSAELASHWLVHEELRRVFAGTVPIRTNGRWVLKEDKNAVSYVAGVTGFSFDKATRTQTQNVKLVHRALSDAVRSKKR